MKNVPYTARFAEWNNLQHFITILWITADKRQDGIPFTVKASKIYDSIREKPLSDSSN